MNVVTKHLFNPTLPELTDEVLRQPTKEEIDSIRCFKYAGFEYAYANCNSDYIRSILDVIPILGRHKRVLIDIKVHHLESEVVPCIPGWHLDGSVNPKKQPKKPEVFTLFVTGSCALTQFLANPIELDVENNWDFGTMSRECGILVPDGSETYTIPSCQFATYGDHHFHRGQPATGKETRLLIRTTETDIIKPRNQIYTPGSYNHV